MGSCCSSEDCFGEDDPGAAYPRRHGPYNIPPTMNYTAARPYNNYARAGWSQADYYRWNGYAPNSWSNNWYSNGHYGYGSRPSAPQYQTWNHYPGAYAMPTLSSRPQRPQYGVQQSDYGAQQPAYGAFTPAVQGSRPHLQGSAEPESPTQSLYGDGPPGAAPDDSPATYWRTNIASMNPKDVRYLPFNFMSRQSRMMN